MSENHTDCNRFAAWLLDGAPGTESPAWSPHLESCSRCREQWSAHQMLVATFAEETVPELSPSFDSGLQHKLNATLEVKPLRGWRLAAMIGYAMIAALLLRWTFARFPLPAISIDPSSPWTVALAIVAVPLTLWLAIGATRWLPPMGRIGFTRLGLL